MRLRKLVVLPVVLCLAVPATPALAGEVNLTRLTVTATTELEPIADPHLQKLCADPEGCEMVLVLRIGSIARTKTGRLFLLPVLEWFSSESLIVTSDNDNVVDVALTLTDFGSGFQCIVSDAESLGPDDGGFGFGLENTGHADGVTCIVTFAD